VRPLQKDMTDKIA